MFFAAVLQEGKNHTFNENDVEKGEILNLTNLCLTSENNAKGSTSFYIKKDGVEYLVYPLTAERSQATVNLFLRFDDEAELLVKGPGKVTVMGYYSVDEMPLGMGPEGDSEDEDEGEDVEEEE